MGRPRQVTEEKLLETARGCFARGGYDGTTLDDIAGQLGVTAAALLRRAGSKNQLFLQSMCSPREQELPASILALSNLESEAEPAVVLRHLAENVIPFLEQKIQQNIVLMMHLASDRGQTVKLPFPPGETSQPAQALAYLETYFRKLRRRGVLKLTNPRAAALLFMGALQSYVFFHRVMRVASPPFPVSKFVSELIQLWLEGGIAPSGSAIAAKSRRPAGISKRQ